jgi:inorganic triphosphatase YgiF
MGSMANDQSSASGNEIELKLSAEPKVLAKLKRAQLWHKLARGRAVTEKLRSVYYDTERLSLKNEGIALRLRHKGKFSTQTVKRAAADPAMAGARGEFDAPLKGLKPLPDPMLVSDKDLRRKLCRLTDKEPLIPVFETVVSRTRRRLCTNEGDDIELAIDLGEIRGRNGQSPISELELELKSGGRAALFRLARVLAAQYPLRLRLQSKAAQGYALVTEETAGPVKAGPVLLAGDASVEEAFEAILRQCLEHFLANEPAVIEAQAPGGVHQVRVALRRLRSAFKAFAHLSKGPETQRLAQEAAAMAQILGEARDYDVFSSEYLTAAKAGMDAHAIGFAEIETATAQAREAAWKRVLALVGSSRFIIFALDLALFIETRAWRSEHIAPKDLGRPARLFAEEVLDDCLKKACKLGNQLETLNGEQRHKLRKQLKKLRYATEFFSSLFKKTQARNYSRKLEKLQDGFGIMNDIATAERLIGAVAGAAVGQGSNPVQVKEIEAALHSWRISRLEKCLQRMIKEWKDFSRAAPYWQHAE